MSQPTPRPSEFYAWHALVLATATDAIAKDGLDGVTLVSIARATKIPRTTIAGHFLGLAGVLREICERHVDELLAAVERADRPRGTTQRRLDAMAAALLRTAARRAAAHHVLAIGLTRLPKPLLADLQRKQGWLATMFAVALESVLPPLQGHRALATAASAALVSLLDGHARWQHPKAALCREDYAKFVVDSILEGTRIALARLG